MTKLVYKNAFDMLMTKKAAKRAKKISRALSLFRECLVDAGVSEEAANKVIRSIKISKLMEAKND